MGIRAGAPPTSRRAAVVLLALAALVHAALFWLEHRPAPRPHCGDETVYAAAAEAILGGRTPDLHLLWPPLYPQFLALLSGSRWAVEILQTLLLVAAALALRGIGRALLGTGPAANVAAMLLVLDPQVAAFSHYLWPEILHLALFLGALWALVRHGDRVAGCAVAGVALGLALLTKSLLGPFLPLVFLLVAIAGPRRGRLWRPAVVAIALFLTVLPTLVAHRQRYGVATIADSSLFNLWVGLNDRGRTSFADEIVFAELTTYLESEPTAPGRDAVLRRKLADFIDRQPLTAILGAQLGRQYFRLFDKSSFLTDQLPGGTLAAQPGCGYVAPAPALAAGLRALAYAIYGLVLVGAVVGMAVAPPRGRPWLWGSLAFLAYNLAIFLLLHVMSRYRIQLLPLLDLYAGAAVAWAVSGGRPMPRPATWAAVATGGLLLLFFAFGGSLVG